MCLQHYLASWCCWILHLPPVCFCFLPMPLRWQCPISAHYRDECWKHISFSFILNGIDTLDTLNAHNVHNILIILNVHNVLNILGIPDILLRSFGDAAGGSRQLPWCFHLRHANRAAGLEQPERRRRQHRHSSTRPQHARHSSLLAPCLPALTLYLP